MGAAEDLKNFHFASNQELEQAKDPDWGGETLRSIPLFSKFKFDELRDLYKVGDIITLSPKAHAVIEGEPTYGMYIVLFGAVSVYKTDPTTSSMIRIALMSEGAHFGELSLFDRAVRSATVSAESLCHLFYLSAESFDRFLKDHPSDLALRFYKTCATELAARIRNLNTDYISSQQLLWKYALRKNDEDDEA